MKGKMIIHDCIIDVEFDSMPTYNAGVTEITHDNGKKSFTVNKETTGWMPFVFKVKEKPSQFTVYYPSGRTVYLICEYGIIQFFSANDRQKYEEDNAVEYELTFDKCELK